MIIYPQTGIQKMHLKVKILYTTEKLQKGVKKVASNCDINCGCNRANISASTDNFFINIHCALPVNKLLILHQNLFVHQTRTQLTELYRVFQSEESFPFLKCSLKGSHASLYILTSFGRLQVLEKLYHFKSISSCRIHQRSSV